MVEPTPSASTSGPQTAAPQPGAAPPHPPEGGAPVHRDYAGDGIVVHWNAERCIHTGRCIAAQRHVFDPKRRPWVEPSLGTVDQIVVAIERCPTGALTYTRTDGGAQESIPELVELRIGRDGPLTLHGAARVIGERVGALDDARTATGRFALCRCGQTGHAPYCDNSHRALAPGWGSDASGNPPALAPVVPDAGS